MRAKPGRLPSAANTRGSSLERGGRDAHSQATLVPPGWIAGAGRRSAAHADPFIAAGEDRHRLAAGPPLAWREPGGSISRYSLRRSSSRRFALGTTAAPTLMVRRENRRGIRTRLSATSRRLAAVSALE